MLLYINNFRGFRQTFIPLTAINFLLGENSTGKTSVLALLNILSKQEFWHSQVNFNIGETQLGHFSEIISSNSPDPFFEIGMWLDNPENREGIQAFYMKFVEEEGSPILSEYKIMVEKKTVASVINKRTVSYDIEGIVEKQKEGESMSLFKAWVEIPINPLLKSNSYAYSGILSPLMLSQIPINIHEKRSISSRLPIHYHFIPIVNNLIWIAPIRVAPKRNYDSFKVPFSSDGEHIPYLLKSILLNENKENTALKESLEKFGQDSNLFQKIEIKTLGEDKTAPFEIHITLNETPLKITNVGYGVSQILPILMEILSRPNGSYFAIQQPEVHIHPKGQAALGELIYSLNEHENKQFMIETHSDFILDRYRLALRKKNKNAVSPKSNAQVLFFERTNEGNRIHSIPIDEQGDYPENQPKSFRDFFIKEEMDMLSY